MSKKNTTNYDNPQSSLADIILVIAKHIKLIFLFTLLATLITIWNVRSNFKPKYTSSAVLFVSIGNSSSSTISSLARQFGVNTGGNVNLDISSAALFPQIANSKTFATRLLKREFYSEKFEQKLPLIAILTYGTNIPTIGLDTLINRNAGTISSMIKFEKKIPFLTLKVTTNYAQFSKDLADAALEELDKLQREFKNKKIVEKQIYIEQQIHIAQIELERLEENIKHFRETNRNIQNSPSLLLIHDRILRDLDIQKGIFLTLKQQLELTKIDKIQQSSLVEVLDYPFLPFTISNKIKMSTYILGGMAGFFLGLFYVFIIEYFSTRNPDETEKLKNAKQFLSKDIKRIFTKKRK